MIDIHSHIIPRVDDGAKDEPMAIEMLKRARKSGTKKIVLTPHYFLGRFTLGKSHIEREFEKLKTLVKENNIDIELYLGQEVYFTKYLLDYLEIGEIGTINGSRYMLIEFDMDKIPNDSIEILYELKIKGIIPIIAHPERYLEFQKDPSKINKFIDEGCLFQLNANSIEGLLGSGSKKLGELFLKENIYSFIGSDAHSQGRRNTDISKYIKDIEKINEKFIKEAEKNGEKLINNEEVLFMGNKIKEKRRSLLAFLGITMKA